MIKSAQVSQSRICIDLNMGFKLRAWFLVLLGFFVSGIVGEEDWSIPELSEVGNPNVVLSKRDEGTFLIKTAEGIKNSEERAIKINYNGNSPLTVTGKNYFDFKLIKNNAENFLVIMNSPDFEPSGTKTDPIVISDGSKTINAFLDLKNIDDNAPQATLPSPTCDIEENSEEIKKPCLIQVHDADGCVSNTDFEITGQDVPFSVVFESGSASKYPDCLDDPADARDVSFKLNLKQPLDYELMRSYFLTISYKDGAGNIGIVPLQLVIQVNDVADMPPMWLKIVSTKTVNEEEEAVIQVQAKDQDVGINADICYKMDSLEDDLNADEQKCFTMNENTGDINICKIYRDIWQRNSYSLLLTAYECKDPNWFVNGTLVLQVLDSINQMFKYVIDGTSDNIFPTVVINENDVITFDNKVTVTDPDEGNAGTFTAKLDHTKFMVLPQKGLKSAEFVIQGLAPLDYENKDERQFIINLVIQEVQDMSHRVTIPITIQVNNLNDNPPVFKNIDAENKDLTVKVREDFESGVLITVEATDADDGDTIKYGMVTYAGLEINPTTGEISATKMVFDYEQQHAVVLQITASDKDEMHTTYVSLRVEVEDINDTKPTIQVETQNTPEVPEDAEMYYEVDVSISASDLDTNHELGASIDWKSSIGTKNNQKVDYTKFEGWFNATMENEKVKIIVADQLEWNTVDTIQLKITVTDFKTEKNPDSSQASVSIIIKDVNNHAPEFGPNCGVIGTLEMKENSPESLVIGTVAATDVDGPDFNKIIYTLADVNEKRIKIDPEKGLISTGENSVDYEVDQTISVDVVATDVTVEKFSNTCNIKIVIIDVNDETPQGTATPAIITIPEDTVNQFLISHVVGIDKDFSAPFNVIRYSLNTFQDYFTLIETNDGVDVVVNFTSEDKHFDYDSNVKNYELAVNLIDNPDDNSGGRFQLSSVTKITVALSDVNDNAPVLSPVSERNCFFSVSESTQGDAPLTGDSKLEATDADSNENSWISYAITSVECELDTMKTCPDDKNELFKVSGNTETVTQNVKADIRSNKPLINKYGEYLVTVIATDHGSPALTSDPQKYRFCIIDENNNAPVIDFPQTIVIYQDETTGQLINETAGSEISLVIATDDDFDKNGEVVFTLEPNDVFNLRTLGANQAKLSLNSGVDLDEHKETVVTINACDSPADGQKCSQQSLTIISHNKIETEPEFPVINFESLLRENDTTALVTLPSATDSNNDNPDVDQAIYYFIISGEPQDYGDYFTLEAENPVLSLKKPLDAFICDQYNLTVQTTNKPSPPFPNPAVKSLLLVNVTVEDINDKFPVFDRDQYTISMSKNDEGRNLLTLKATDPDRHDTVTYSIDFKTIDASHLDTTIDTTNMFSIEEKTGAVKIVHYPSQATRGYVSFSASATDGVHEIYILVSVYVVSEEYLIPIQFGNTEAQVAAHSNEVVQKLTQVFGAKCVPGPTSSDKDYTTLRVHFEDENSIPIEPTDLSSVTNNVTAMEDLRTFLQVSYQLFLVKIGTDAVKNDTPEEINTALIAVSAVLAALLVASALFFCIKHRNLMKHVDRLTKASTETSLEAKGTILPNTNQNIGIGSNPLYNAELVNDLDNISTTSSIDSELIGIEENPEFDKFYNEMQERAKATGSNMDDMLRENPQLRGLQLTNEVDLGY